MASIRDLVAKAVAAGFTGKGIRNAPTGVKPSPRRTKIGNADFDQLGKRQQKIVRRMAMGDRFTVSQTGQRQISDGYWGRRCNVRAKDVIAIGLLRDALPTKQFSAMLDAVRSHYQL